MNAQPGELPKQATDPDANRPDISKIDSANLAPTIDPERIGTPGISEPSTVSAGEGPGTVETHPTVAVTNPDQDSVSSADVQGPRPVEKDPAGRQGQLLSFGEIRQIKSSSERIATYNNTRSQWIDMNPGLDNWVSQTLQKYPEHERLKQEALLPITSSGYASASATPSPSYSRSQHGKSTSIGKIFAIGGQSSVDVGAGTESSPNEKRTSGSGAAKVGETLNRLGGKGKGLLERMGRGRLRSGGHDVGN